MADIVSARINGKSFSGWESLTITRTLDSVADAFSLSGPFNPASDDLRSSFRPFGYQNTDIMIDDELILTGRIESVSGSVSASDRVINAQGRSLTGSLVDCSVDIGRYQFDGLSLSTIAKEICRPYGIEVFAVNDTNPIKEARAEPGQTGFDFLNRLAQDVGLLLTCDEKGRLIIILPNPSASPVSALVEWSGPVMEISGSYDGAQRFSQYKVLQQQDGNANITGKSVDSGVKIYRPKIESGAEGDAKNVNESAKWRRGLALAGAVGLNVTLSGWRNSARAIWKPGDIVTVLSPGAFIFTESAFMIAQATLTMDTSSGRKTGLRLVLPGTYSGEVPEVEPWA